MSAFPPRWPTTHHPSALPLPPRLPLHPAWPRTRTHPQGCVSLSALPLGQVVASDAAGPVALGLEPFCLLLADVARGSFLANVKLLGGMHLFYKEVGGAQHSTAQHGMRAAAAALFCAFGCIDADLRRDIVIVIAIVILSWAKVSSDPTSCPLLTP